MDPAEPRRVEEKCPLYLWWKQIWPLISVRRNVAKLPWNLLELPFHILRRQKGSSEIFHQTKDFTDTTRCLWEPLHGEVKVLTGSRCSNQANSWGILIYGRTEVTIQLTNQWPAVSVAPPWLVTQAKGSETGTEWLTIYGKVSSTISDDGNTSWVQLN